MTTAAGHPLDTLKVDMIRDRTAIFPTINTI